MASRKEQKEALRQERLAREADAAAAARRKRLIGYGVGGALALAAIVAIVVALTAGSGDGGGNGGDGGDFAKGDVPDQKLTDLGPAARAAKCTVTNAESEGNRHTTDPVQYRSRPPHSGDHNPQPAEDGAYHSDPPSLESLVHALEHGRIIIWFKPTVPEKLKGDLKVLFDEDPYHVLLVPDQSEMEFEVAATAWTHVLGCPKADDGVFDAIRAFKERFRDRGPEFVP
jgi:hypothetical protein